MSAATKGRPPFRADHVGSLLRPAALRQAFRRHAAKEIGDAEFGKLQDQCIRDVLAMQEQVGLKVVSDGEFRRGSYWGRFVERTDGFEIRGAQFRFRNDQGVRPSQRVAARDFLAPVRAEHEERPLFRGFRERRKELKGGRVRPLEVVEEDDRRFAC